MASARLATPARRSTSVTSCVAACAAASSSTWRSVPAKRLVSDLCLSDDFVDFLTLPAYELVK